MTFDKNDKVDTRHTEAARPSLPTLADYPMKDIHAAFGIKGMDSKSSTRVAEGEADPTHGGYDFIAIAKKLKDIKDQQKAEGQV